MPGERTNSFVVWTDEYLRGEGPVNARSARTMQSTGGNPVPPAQDGCG